MGSLVCLTSDGDVTVEWDPSDEASTTKAKEEWQRLQGEGYEFFEVVDAKGKRLTKFDEKLGKVIASPGVRTAKDKEGGKRERAMAGGPRESVAARL